MENKQKFEKLCWFVDDFPLLILSQNNPKKTLENIFANVRVCRKFKKKEALKKFKIGKMFESAFKNS